MNTCTIDGLLAFAVRSVHPSRVPRLKTALTAKALPVAERKARLARMVVDGEISVERAALIDFREPTQKEREYAKALVGKGREALTRGGHSPA